MKTKETKKDYYLKKGEAGLIFSSKRITVIIPKIDPVPLHCQIVVALGVMFAEGDERIKRLVNKKCKELDKVMRAGVKEGLNKVIKAEVEK
jgi:hypothetical protein